MKQHEKSQFSELAERIAELGPRDRSSIIMELGLDDDEIRAADLERLLPPDSPDPRQLSIVEM